MSSTNERNGAEDPRKKPESLRLRSTSAGITVRDLEASLAWYTGVVGFTLEETWESDGKVNAASLIAGTERLMLSQDDGAKGWDRTKGEGIRLWFTTAQDVDRIAARIVERGGSVASGPEDLPWGPRAIALLDPDGFKMTIVAEGEEEGED